MYGGIGMHYVVSDVHNDNHRLCELLRMVSFSEEDKLIVLGDLFDRCDCGCRSGTLGGCFDE